MEMKRQELHIQEGDGSGGEGEVLPRADGKGDFNHEVQGNLHAVQHIDIDILREDNLFGGCQHLPQNVKLVLVRFGFSVFYPFKPAPGFQLRGTLQAQEDIDAGDPPGQYLDFQGDDGAGLEFAFRLAGDGLGQGFGNGGGVPVLLGLDRRDHFGRISQGDAARDLKQNAEGNLDVDDSIGAEHNRLTDIGHMPGLNRLVMQLILPKELIQVLHFIAELLVFLRVADCLGLIGDRNGQLVRLLNGGFVVNKQANLIAAPVAGGLFDADSECVSAGHLEIMGEIDPDFIGLAEGVRRGFPCRRAVPDQGCAFIQHDAFRVHPHLLVFRLIVPENLLDAGRRAGDRHHAPVRFGDGGRFIIGDLIQVIRIGQEKALSDRQAAGFQFPQANLPGADPEEVFRTDIGEINHAVAEIKIGGRLERVAVFLRPGMGIGGVDRPDFGAPGKGARADGQHIARDFHDADAFQRAQRGRGDADRIRAAEAVRDRQRLIRFSPVAGNHGVVFLFDQDILPGSVRERVRFFSLLRLLKQGRESILVHRGCRLRLGPGCQDPFAKGSHRQRAGNNAGNQQKSDDFLPVSHLFYFLPGHF